MAVTIKDVAKMAGVSISTVSMVLNGNPAIKLGTRKKVLAVIEQCNYKPNQNARSLVTKSNKIIGVIRMTDEATPAPHIFNSTVDTYLSEMLWDMEAVAHEKDYSLILDWHDINDTRKILPGIVDPNKVDGIICVGGIITDSFIDALSNSKIPVVLVGARSEKIDFVDADSEKAIFLTTSYLIEAGNGRIAFINNIGTSQSASRKLAGFENAVKDRQVRTWITSARFSGQSAYDAFAEIWKTSDEKPTAVVCSSDCIAIGVMRYMNDHGLRCPDDISVTGYEDGLLSEYSIPALSTARIHKARIGLEACEVLFNRISNRRARHVSRIIEPELVIRDSVKRLNQGS
ncbi:LacI family DNA-binding transcriptional regulator [Breznakiella homolactica]|uniref:LacI family DNA-binding transcriptional regulator n=1 Tax=Breznakiella homolactica TaxID=2798577 RepID=A0A7T7XLQ6_9SPIR|nr:LacI family DNA-binding transcriptional regulator [Breznakiella homolactica]QQO08700.1 LacI family transcriptional regulator [Breznakiella homolactica]